MPLKRALRNFDDILHIVTGKRMKNIAGATFNSFGEDAARKVGKKVAEFFAEELPADSPYRVLGVNPDAPDFLVRAAYKSHAKRTHPDVGGNEEEFKKIQEAYEQICLEREMSK